MLANALDAGGEYAYRVRGEDHLWTPDAIAKLQHSTRANNFSTYKEYAQIINDQTRRHLTLRGLFEFKIDPAKAIPLDEVEPAKEIVKRFATGAMSLGSISTEAHATLAIAMNRIGGKSQHRRRRRRPAPLHGRIQGHQDRQGRDAWPRSWARTASWPTSRCRKAIRCARRSSRWRRAASASPPNTWRRPTRSRSRWRRAPSRAKAASCRATRCPSTSPSLRFSVPGVGLISPPPHHDIYSIEDLAQLIHDLKNANPRASISVKLVSEVGIGTVAAGVSKAKADHVVVAGHDGGTGASPLSSVKHAGTPWELGLAETQQTLVLNGLRSRIRVQADGQMRTGRDVVIAAMLGADEIGFATAPLVVEGCIMMRKCHLNTCPVGVATQDPVLRAKFQGKPEHVVNYFFFVAEEARQIMAQLGIRTYDELIGRADLLDKSKAVTHWKAQGLDFSNIFYQPKVDDAARPAAQRRAGPRPGQGARPQADRAGQGRRWRRASASRSSRRCATSTARSAPCCRAKWPSATAMPACRTTPSTSSCRARRASRPAPSWRHGITLDLVGEGNDYVGKGLSGGRIIVRPNTEFRGWAVDNIIVGNTVLYGAIAGEAFFNGVAGERFAVRNSGATAVVEGLGDHGCEYMTGGTVVVLGDTGRNFAAGMSGGVAYVYDPKGEFEQKCNTSHGEPGARAVDQGAGRQVELAQPDPRRRARVGRSDPEAPDRAPLQAHRLAPARATCWTTGPTSRGKFVKVFPTDYKRALEEMHNSSMEEANDKIELAA